MGLPVATTSGPATGSRSTPGPYGSLDGRPADANGLVLPEGFTARVVAEGGSPVPGNDQPWPLFVERGRRACFVCSEMMNRK